MSSRKEKQRRREEGDSVALRRENAAFERKVIALRDQLGAAAKSRRLRKRRRLARVALSALAVAFVVFALALAIQEGPRW